MASPYKRRPFRLVEAPPEFQHFTLETCFDPLNPVIPQDSFTIPISNDLDPCLEPAFSPNTPDVIDLTYSDDTLESQPNQHQRAPEGFPGHDVSSMKMQTRFTTPSPISPTRPGLTRNSSSSEQISSGPPTPNGQQTISRVPWGKDDKDEMELHSFAPSIQQFTKIIGDDFIREYDPFNPEESLAGKRRRDQAEIEEQKENTTLLKLYGGSCLWCLRTKKRCEASEICEACKSHGRTCYRNQWRFARTNCFRRRVFPCPDAQHALLTMNNEAFEYTQQFELGINMHPHNGNQPWTFTVCREQMVWHNGSYLQSPLNKLVDDVVRSLAPSFPQNNDQLNPIIGRALDICKVFLVVQWLARAKVFTTAKDINIGRTAIFHLLGACFCNLFELSAHFCDELFLGLRKGSPKSGADLDPAWVAMALYYKVSRGLVELQSSPVVKKLVGTGVTFDGQCHSAREALGSWMPRHGAASKTVKDQILRDDIPELRLDIQADVEFWQNRMVDEFSSHDFALQPPIDMADFLFNQPAQPVPTPFNMGELSTDLSFGMYNGYEELEKDAEFALLQYINPEVLEQAPEDGYGPSSIAGPSPVVAPEADDDIVFSVPLADPFFRT